MSRTVWFTGLTGAGNTTLARSIIGAKSMFEVHVSTPLAVCESRDRKGLCKRPRLGEIADFIGVSAPYLALLNPELSLDTSALSPAVSWADHSAAISLRRQSCLIAS